MRDDSKTLESLMSIADETHKSVSSLSIPFGESVSTAALMNRDQNETSKIVHNIANTVFGGEELARAAENKGFDTKDASTDAFNINLLKTMKENYIAKAESFTVYGTPGPGQYALNDGNKINCQLKDAALVGLVDGQVYPTYNKFLKVQVSPTDTVKREYNVEYILDPVSKRYYSLKDYRNNKALRDSFGNVTPEYAIEVTVPASGVVSGNLFDIHNAAMTAAGTLDKLISKDYMYIRNQVKILNLEIVKGAGTPVKISTDFESTGFPAQSGQMLGQTASIAKVITITDATDKDKIADTIRLSGQIFQNGEFDLTFIAADLSGAGKPYKVNKVWVTIVLPMIGNNESFMVGSTSTVMVKEIMHRENYSTTFSQYFQDQYKEKTQRNLLEQWTSTVTKSLQLKKDAYAIDQIIKRQAELELNTTALATTGAVVTNNALGETKIGVSETIDLTNFNAKFDSRVGGASTAFAETSNAMLANIRNQLLQTDTTTVFLGGDTSAYWIKNENGTHNGYLQYVGSLAQEVHGIAIKSELMRIKVGTYAGYFVTTDDPRFVQVAKNYTPAGGTPTTRGVETIYVIPRPEANKDTFIFGEGREYLEHTTGTPEAGRDQSLNYHTGFQLFEYNAILGKITMKLEPRS